MNSIRGTKSSLKVVAGNLTFAVAACKGSSTLFLYIVILDGVRGFFNELDFVRVDFRHAEDVLCMQFSVVPRMF